MCPTSIFWLFSCPRGEIFHHLLISGWMDQSRMDICSRLIYSFVMSLSIITSRKGTSFHDWPCSYGIMGSHHRCFPNVSSCMVRNYCNYLYSVPNLKNSFQKHKFPLFFLWKFGTVNTLVLRWRIHVHRNFSISQNHFSLQF